MPDDLRARLKARIHDLVNRGDTICEAWREHSDRHMRGCRQCGYDADVHLLRDVLAALEAVVPPQVAGERERLHELIADLYSVIDPEEHPDLDARCNAVLLPCDEAGHCIPLQGLPAEPGTRE